MKEKEDLKSLLKKVELEEQVHVTSENSLRGYVEAPSII